MPTPVVGSNPLGILALITTLSHARTYAIVGQALATRFPDEAAWQQCVTDPTFIAQIDELEQALRQVRTNLPELKDLLDDPEAVQEAVEAHYPVALDAVQELATALAVPPEDLLVFLVA